MYNETSVRIYYEDTDAGGIVYHGQYLNFGERGRTEFLRSCGYLNTQVEKDFGCIFVVRHIDIDYLKPAILDDDLVMRSSISELKNSSFIMHQALYRGEEQISDMHVVLVCVDSESYKPMRLPVTIKESFQKYIESVS